MVLIVLGLIIMWVLKTRGDPNIPDRSYQSIAVLSFLLGANFLLVEHHLVFVLFKIHYVFQDALMSGAVMFLVFSGLGSMISSSHLRKAMILVALVCYLLISLGSSWMPNWVVLGLMIAPAVATGTFFPLLFERCAYNPLGVFALDAIGAGFGSLLAASLPILFGFQFYNIFAFVVFTITVVNDHWFHRGLPQVFSPVPESS
jgi:hypothetical protein